jgi:hypothetical protein
MKKPILLQKKDLIKPIDQALERIEKIRKLKVSNTDNIILEGLFTLGVSSFENSIIDTLRIILTNIPEKLDIKNESVSKGNLINGSSLEVAIENKVNIISYKNISDILKNFSSAIGIPNDIISTEEINTLIEVKATRNLLMHNNLIINPFYLDIAGPKKRESRLNIRLSISQDYLYSSIVIIRTILEKYKTEIDKKFSNYTRINAIKKLFNYIFQTPIMKFENEFETNLDGDYTYVSEKGNSRKNGLSSSERLFYDIWVAHLNGETFNFDGGLFYGIGNRDKLSFFIKNIDILKS